MRQKGYYNGDFKYVDEITVPVTDRAYCFGDGVYDAIWVQEGRPFLLDDHISRLNYSCAALRIKYFTEREWLCSVMARLVAGTSGTGMIYVQVSRGSGPRSHTFPAEPQPNVFMYFGENELAPKEKTLKVVTMADIRYDMCGIKTINLLPNVMAAQAAAEFGCNEAVFCREEEVTECSHSGIAILKKGRVITHPLDCRILPSVTRKQLMRCLNAAGIPVDERPFTRTEMFGADEIMVMSTSSMLHRVTEADGQPVGGGDTAGFSRIQDMLYAELYATVANEPPLI